MKPVKQAKLEAKGWRVGSAQEFVGLTAEESALIAVKLTLADQVRKRRQGRQWTQGDLARRLGSSQSRVAKLEAGDPAVSVDLLLRSLFVLGATAREVGGVLRRRRSVRQET